ncbi:MAG TPA: CDP-alcohol phosphatidyltransferase family protein [Oligoflexus sp.]|uniref:CDP-alcohol phosphatidyltransferase family protein n=1 Tax=Oligoflexus sp. TaxID=1971216 RepID=UPI002D7F29ED|nr:CDP-alcohol phosphatidyltransferase family protein [Oligoflexus sp.]HET9235622.1 CDP-alcohol phosphatidyltransferase family protein [Oligoflexus sp.]
MNGIQRAVPVKSLRSQVPNTLTVSRLLLGLGFPWLPAQLWLPALIWGTLSEFLDGFLARRMKVVSAFGQLMDPIADKIFVMTAALTFLQTGWIKLHELLFMATRDIFVAVSSLILLLLGKSSAFRDMAPARLGKWATAFQFAALFGVPILRQNNTILIYVTGLISALAAIDYAIRFLQRP